MTTWQTSGVMLHSSGQRLFSGTITLFGIYEHDTNLGFHFQVKDRSQAVLISEIQQFISPGTRIFYNKIE